MMGRYQHNRNRTKWRDATRAPSVSLSDPVSQGQLTPLNPDGSGQAPRGGRERGPRSGRPRRAPITIDPSGNRVADAPGGLKPVARYGTSRSVARAVLRRVNPLLAAYGFFDDAFRFANMITGGILTWGYTLQRDCGRSRDFFSRTTFNVCGDTTADLLKTSAITLADMGRSTIGVWQINQDLLVAYRCQRAQVWARVAAEANPNFGPRAAASPVVGGSMGTQPVTPVPWFNPTHAPVWDLPRPIPWTLAPLRRNGGWPQFFDSGNTAPKPVNDPFRPPSALRTPEQIYPSPLPGYAPGRPPRADGKGNPVPSPRASFQRNPPLRNAPPRVGEKERKVGGAAAPFLKFAFEGLGHYSEASDFIDAVYEALPADVRRRNPSRTPYDRLRTLARHWDKLDAPQAVLNVIYNQIEDAIIGRGIAHVDKMLGKGAFNNLARILQARTISGVSL